MKYRIEVRPAALPAMRKLDRDHAQRIRAAIALLAHNPRPAAARPLKERPAWRVRVGDYRITYSIDDDVLLIVVITLGHRQDVYGT